MQTSVKGWRRVRDSCDDLAIVLRYFLSHKKVLHVILLGELFATVRDKFVMHARTLRSHAMV